jgi:hypothetical protein
MVTTKLMLEDETAITFMLPYKSKRAILGQRLIEGETYNE